MARVMSRSLPTGRLLNVIAGGGLFPIAVSAASAPDAPERTRAEWKEPATGRFDGENFQFGLLDLCDTPYRETINAVREMGSSMYAIRWGRKLKRSTKRNRREP
jgi:hypothetical protein